MPDVLEDRPLQGGAREVVSVTQENAVDALRVTSDPGDPFEVQYGDSASIDAFGRARVSEPFAVFDSKLLHDKAPLFWDEVITDVSGSATSVHSTVNAAVTMHVDGNGDIVERQTLMRFNYQPGKSQLIFMTGVLGAGVADVIRRIGAFDANNGLIFELDGTTLSVVTRKNTVDTPTAQADWNLDKMNGSGPSGVTLNTSKVQIFVVDYEWLGVGRVRFGFVIDGQTIYVHEENHANVDTSVYMSTPTLPVRYEITSTGGAGDLVHICSSVNSEGGIDPNGVLRSQNLQNTAITLPTANQSYALVGIRLKTTHFDKQIDEVRASAVTNTAAAVFLWELLLNPTISGTFTYGDLTNSALQTAISGATPPTVTNRGTIIDSGYGAGRSDIAIDLKNALRIGATIAGVADQLVLAVTPPANNQDYLASLTWREV